MEIIIFDVNNLVDSGFNYNVTKRERNPVSRTSDGSSGSKSFDLGKLCYDLDCVIFGKLDHEFRFRKAIRNKYYNAFNDILIDSSFSIVEPNGNIHELIKNLSVGYAVGTLFPTLYSYNGLSYDIFSILKTKLKNLKKDYVIDPNTFFITNVLTDSGFTEIAYDCSPTTIIKKYKSVIEFDNDEYKQSDNNKFFKLRSNIQLYEILVKG